MVTATIVMRQDGSAEFLAKRSPLDTAGQMADIKALTDSGSDIYVRGIVISDSKGTLWNRSIRTVASAPKAAKARKG